MRRLRELLGGARALGRLPRPARWGLIAVGIVVVVVFLLAYAIDEPLRRYVESRMNASLEGYHASIAALDFHPIGLSVTLRDVTFIQDARPDPPVLHVPRLDASVQWRAILRARLVANFTFTRPVLYADMTHLKAEAADPKPVTDKGWQDAFQAIYPLKINELKIVDGHVTYWSGGPFAPLHVSHLNLRADNIRNVKSEPNDYPSAVRASAKLFDTGSVEIDGHADFLAVPHPGVKATVSLGEIDLDHFKAISQPFGVAIKGGHLTASGLVEYAPTMKVVDLRQAVVDGVTVEYMHVPQRQGVVREATAKTATAAQEATNAPDVLIRAQEVKVVNSTVGFVNRAVTPAYRAFVSHLALTVENFSNQLADGEMLARLSGRFMGSGPTTATATFRPERNGPDFDLSLRIENTDMRTMNDMLRGYGKFDVTAGNFTLYSEIAAKNRHIDGYVKPLFSGLDVYSPEQDRQKSFGRRLYEKAVEGVSKVLKNLPRREVATVVTLSGPIDGAQPNTVEVILKLIQNAFFKAILPGFERQAIRPARAS
jgi:hypothetical protein